MAVINFQLQLDRQFAGPLDVYSLFESKAAAEDFAKNNSLAYPGQLISIADGKLVQCYVISSDKTLQELGGGAQGGTGNLGDYLPLTGGTLSGNITVPSIMFADDDVVYDKVSHVHGNLGWVNDAQNKKELVALDVLAYWNGRYNSTTSNLLYFKNGEIAAKNHTHTNDSSIGGPYASSSHTHTEYAASSHTHKQADITDFGGPYALETHTHTGYASSSHTHSNGTTIGGPYLLQTGGQISGSLSVTGTTTSASSYQLGSNASFDLGSSPGHAGTVMPGKVTFGDGAGISQDKQESAGIWLNGDTIIMWSPCDSGAINYYDEDDGSLIFKIDSDGNIINKAGNVMYSASNPPPSTQITIEDWRS